MGLLLGSVIFTDFEIPSSISFGGGQALAVYRLPGGARVVDTLGPDDADIAWRGVLSGPDATDRARALDAMRIAGIPVTLSWDEFYYSVVIARLEITFCNSWWIPYRMSCLVVGNPGVKLTNPVMPIFDLVVADLAAAGTFSNVSAASNALSLAGTVSAGTAEYATADAALLDAGQSIAASIAAAEAAISSDNIITIVNAAGALAAATAANGYVMRAIANYSQVTN